MQALLSYRRGLPWFRSNWPFIVLVCWLSACNPIDSSRSPMSGGSENAAATTTCEAPGLPVAVSNAVCSGDPKSLRNALSNLREEAGPSGYVTALSALNQLWKLDKTYGKTLPWHSLESAPMRAPVAETIAQATRNGDIQASLPDIRQFALKFADSASDREFDGVTLLGMADAEDEIPRLKAMALADDPSARRQQAIIALGMICNDSADKSLQEVLHAGNLTDANRRAVEFARESRRSLSESWCRPANPSQ